jgi:hypothetical protein
MSWVGATPSLTGFPRGEYPKFYGYTCDKNVTKYKINKKNPLSPTPPPPQTKTPTSPPQPSRMAETALTLF